MTTDQATLNEARAAGIDAAADHVSAYLDASAVGMEAAGVPSAYKYLKPLEHVLEALRKLAAETRKAEPVKPNPFEGWTVPCCWTWDSRLLARKGDRETGLADVSQDGWVVWTPDDPRGFDRGPETGDEGRKLAEKALVEAGANIPWHRDTTSADLIEAAGRG